MSAASLPVVLWTAGLLALFLLHACKQRCPDTTYRSTTVMRTAGQGATQHWRHSEVAPKEMCGGRCPTWWHQTWPATNSHYSHSRARYQCNCVSEGETRNRGSWWCSRLGAHTHFLAACAHLQPQRYAENLAPYTPHHTQDQSACALCSLPVGGRNAWHCAGSSSSEPPQTNTAHIPFQLSAQATQHGVHSLDWCCTLQSVLHS